jgi:8-oxo-dGTP pyrophosphatase MutT (NUDIX family)
MGIIVGMMERNFKKTETVVFSGRIGEVVHETQHDGRVFERYRRPPGVRLVIVSPDKKVLITKERRSETGNVDLRLPGGKVCDSLSAYNELLASGGDMLTAAIEAAQKEAIEETGLIIRNPSLIAKAGDGATVEWDLYYFLVTDYGSNPSGQQLEHGEDIKITWMSPESIRQAVINGEMQEWRSVGILLGSILPELEATI